MIEKVLLRGGCPDLRRTVNKFIDAFNLLEEEFKESQKRKPGRPKKDGNPDK